MPWNNLWRLFWGILDSRHPLIYTAECNNADRLVLIPFLSRRPTRPRLLADHRSATVSIGCPVLKSWEFSQSRRRASNYRNVTTTKTGWLWTERRSFAPRKSPSCLMSIALARAYIRRHNTGTESLKLIMSAQSQNCAYAFRVIIASLWVNSFTKMCAFRGRYDGQARV